jgi:hypothetical protein
MSFNAMNSGSTTQKIGAMGVAVCLILTPLLTANGQHHRSTSSTRSSSSLSGHSTADYSALNSASARQKANQNDLKILERQSARLAATPQQPTKTSSQRIKPLKLDGTSGGSKINFTGKTQKIHSTGGARGRSMRSVGSRHH